MMIYLRDRVENTGKRRKCWLSAFSPFPTVFYKDFFFRGVKNRDYMIPFARRLNFRFVDIERICSRRIKCFPNDCLNRLLNDRKHCWKKKKCWCSVFSSFPTMFSKYFSLRVDNSRDYICNGLTIYHTVKCLMIDRLNCVLRRFQQYFSHITATAHIIHVFNGFHQY